MVKRFVLMYAATFFSLITMAQKTDLQKLEKAIQEQIAITGAEFGIAFRDLQNGNTMLWNADVSFHAASTMKTPVLVELYKQAAAGLFSMSDSVLVKNNFSSIADGSPYSLSSEEDSEPELYRHVGSKWPIDSLAYYMIIKSSNLATNLLIELVGAQNIMRTLKQLGAQKIKVLRGVEDGKAYEKGLNNTTTAYDLMLIYSKMGEGKLVNANASEKMIAILLDQRFNEIIPAQLPANVKVAHKTGFITGIQHDSGIVFLPDGRKYVLVLLSRFNAADEPKVIDALASVSKLVYNYMMNR